MIITVPVRVEVDLDRYALQPEFSGDERKTQSAVRREVRLIALKAVSDRLFHDQVNGEDAGDACDDVSLHAVEY